MAEIKHNFAGGKMNKDVDERLVPNGEYRDAMNIQVSTSEGSDVGTIQNILGNEEVNMPNVSDNSICVGSIADEKNDAFYWLVKENYEETFSISNPRDIIFQHKNNITTHVFVDIKPPTISVATLQAPSSGNIIINSLDGINALSVGDKLVNWTDSGLSIGSDFVIIQSINVSTLTINVGNYTNADWANHQPSSQTPGVINFQIENSGGVLNFPDNTITGINIIDDLLFWTDNATEPKVINIPRSIEGTNPNGLQHTLLINEEQNITTSSGIDIQEEHITVIKKSPKTVLTVDVETNLEHAEGETDSFSFGDPSGGMLNAGTTGLQMRFHYGGSSPADEIINVGDNIVVNPKYDLNGTLIAQTPPEYYEVSLTVDSIQTQTSGYVDCLVTINSIDSSTQAASIVYNWAVNANDKRKFKNKFPRFSYRYKYIDGEYSTYAPFTNVIFRTGDKFQYEVKEAYNLGMENEITRVVLKGYDANVPDGVVSIDLLYKESNSPLIYLIDTVSFDSYWDGNIGYEVKPDTTKAVIPENQLLRPFDNVPKKALAQSVVGSRVVYGNYQQNYDEERFRISASLSSRSTCDIEYSKKSLKSIRNYTLGISYLDQYGRQTPVFTNKSAEVEIPISNSPSNNQLKAWPSGDIPNWATHYKVFIKETSNEYYNLAMDRIYDAEDGNIWLAFPSSDRNKVDEETFLILKKSSDTISPILENNRYKILAIENEAPDFVRTKKHFIGESNTNPGAPTGPPVHIFDIPTTTPIKTRQRIDIFMQAWDAFEMPLGDIELPASVRFSIDLPNGSRQYTQHYRVLSIEKAYGTPPTHYSLKLHKEIEESWLETTPVSQTMVPSLKMRVYRWIRESSPIFDGRFFVKVKRDGLINEKVLNQATLDQQLSIQGSVSLPFYYLADGNCDSGDDTTSSVTGNTTGDSDQSGDWDILLSPNTTTPALQPMWFIDSAYFDGFYEEGGNLNEGMWATGACSGGNFVNTHPFASTSGYNKGIYEENGKFYIDLAFGGLLPAEPKFGEISLHQDSSNTTAVADGATDWAQAISGSVSCADGSFASFYEEIWGTEGTTSWDLEKHWKVGSNVNMSHVDQLAIRQHLVSGQQFRFVGDADTIYTITGDPSRKFCVNHYNAASVQDVFDNELLTYLTWSTSMVAGVGMVFDAMHLLGHQNNRRTVFKIEIDKDPRIQTFNPIDSSNADALTPGGVEFVELDWMAPEDQIVPADPAIWETEPKEDVDMNIYYEAESTFPLTINDNTNYGFAPVGTTVTNSGGSFSFPTNAKVVSWEDNILELDQGVQTNAPGQVNTSLTFHRKDGSCVNATLVNIAPPILTDPNGNNFSFHLEVNPDVSTNPVNLSWFNCYSWGNGVESNRIRDDYNQVFIDKGAKASSTIEEPYKEEHRKYGLIYSGLYNSTSGVNNLNQFIQAEKITKDVNPTYGSIQKLHTRDSDLLAFCEDKVLKILSKKDALFNADSNPQLTATDRVLGQTIPFVGDFGISTNPESFAAESYRAYFTDRVRGAVMRLSMDGLTPISMHGMKDWFKDNLKLNNTILGSYDDKKDEYNITLQQTTEEIPKTISFREDVKGWVSFKSFVPENAVSCANEYYTFNKGKVWKHHVEQFDAVGKEINRNTFYNIPRDSSFEVLLNDVPGSVKSFTTLNYEGSDSRIVENLLDNDYYNLSNRKGWYVDKISTDLETGALNEFIEKEGKWFNYIKGENIQVDESTNNILLNSDGSSTFDQASFAIQGFGILQYPPVQTSVSGCTDSTAYNYNPDATVDDGSCEAILYGCTEPSADNYYSGANTADLSCLWFGCTCATFVDCTNTTQFPPEAYTFNNGSGIMDDGSCIAVVLGCTDPLASNYNPNANTDDGSCIIVVNGCLIPSANNYDPLANTDDGTCTWTGCTHPLASNTTVFPTEATNYIAFAGAQYGIQDDGSCIGSGCMDATATNYDAAAIYDVLNPFAPDYSSTNGSCVYCDFTTPAGGYNGVPVTVNAIDTSGAPYNNGVIEATANLTAPYQPFTYVLENSTGSTNFGSVTPSNSGVTTFYNLPADTYTLYLTGTPAVCTYTVTNIVVNVGAAPPAYGCTDQTACNYDPLADTNQGCEWTTCAGCMDGTANNYGTQTSTSLPCYIDGSYNAGPCTIACGDGNNDTDQGDYCCTYNYGCTDPSATNFDPAAVIDDGSCVYNTPGCTDPLATNYNSAATVDDGSCQYTSNGCTDSNACNYDVGATVDDGSCVYGFSNLMVGDPTTTDGSGNLVPTPVFYDDINNPVTTVKHHIFPTAVPASSQYPNTTYTTALPYYPADTLTENDLGFSFLSDNMQQYSGSDKIIIELWKNTPTGAVLEFTKEIPNPTFLNLQGLPFGDRVNSLPYGFGQNFGVLSLDDPTNYEFDIYQSNGVSKQLYSVVLKSEIDGVVYGDQAGSTPSCGAYQAFQFTTLSACNHPSSITGCSSNPCAINYNPNATCEEPCTVPTTQQYVWENDPNNASQNICQCMPFGYSGQSTIYSDLTSCCSDNSPNGGPACPQSLSGSASG